tara:strand:- start:5820 stop:6011 length:192 start_codon:yes stop_codon:yes gene_type:complete
MPPQFIPATGQIITFTTDQDTGAIIGTPTNVQGYTTPPKVETKPNIIETTQGLYDADKKEWIK